MLCFLSLTVGWLLLSYAQWGDAVINKLLGKELMSHAVSGDSAKFPGAQIYQQPFYYLGRAAPWSILAYFGLWRIWARPAMAVEARQLERFLFCWFTGGLLVLSLAPHQRADLLWPLMPAGALIAGVELDRLTGRISSTRLWQGLAIAVLMGLGGLTFYYTVMKGKEPVVRQTMVIKEFAGQLERTLGSEFPLTHVDAPMTFQVYLNTMRKPVTLARATVLLQSKEPAFVVGTTRRHRNC